MNLFDAKCGKDGFVITVDEDCRKTDFNGIDFDGTFMWGNKNISGIRDFKYLVLPKSISLYTMIILNICLNRNG